MDESIVVLPTCSLPHFFFSFSSVQVLHENAEFPVGVSEFTLHGLPLQDEGSDLHEVLVALHALVVPGKEEYGLGLTFRYMDMFRKSCKETKRRELP